MIASDKILTDAEVEAIWRKGENNRAMLMWSDLKSLCDSHLAQARAAASLRQRLDLQCADTQRCLDKLIEVRDQLEQAQKERESWRILANESNKGRDVCQAEYVKMQARASQAEAALAALQETYDRVEAACVQFEAQSMEQTALAIEAEAALKEIQEQLEAFEHDEIDWSEIKFQRRRSRPAQ